MAGRDLWVVGKNFAENHSWFKSIRHSKFADPFRRKSASRVGKMAATIGTSFIPIPVVKDFVSGAVKYGLAMARERQLSRQRSEAVTPETNTKWGWKDLDVTMMDRYRWKIQHGVKVFNDAFKKAKDNENDSSTICNDFGKAVSKFCYLENRIKKMEDRVEILKALIADSEEWLNGITKDPTFMANKVALQTKCDALTAGDATDQHNECADTLCVHKTDKRFWERNKTFVAGVSSITAFVTDDVGFTPINTAIYSESNYQEAE